MLQLWATWIDSRLSNLANSSVPLLTTLGWMRQYRSCGNREFHLHTDLVQGVHKLADRLPFPLEAGRIGDQGADRLPIKWGLDGPAFVDIAVAAVGQLAKQQLLVWGVT